MMKAKGNIGVERAVLAGLCQYGRPAYYDVSDLIAAKVFSIDANEAMYKCLEKVFTQIEKPDPTSIMAAADSLCLSDLLTKNKVDVDYIRSLFNFPIKLENIRPHAKQLAKIDIIRKEQVALHNAQDELNNFDGTEALSKILGVGENAVFGLINELNGRNEDAPQQIVVDTKAKLQNLLKNPIKNIGIPTPWPIFNRLIGGGVRVGVGLIGARPKQGKSSLALNCGVHVAKMDIPTLYLDSEMLREEQDNRAIAHFGQVDVDLIETGNFGLDYTCEKEVWKAYEGLSKLPLYHKFIGGMEFQDILSVIRRWIYSTVGFDEFGKPNPHFVIYDYFKLMNDSSLDKMAEHQAIGFQITYLSDFCKLFNTPCLAFVQINRDGITKDSSDIVSMSDRLLWLCTFLASLKRLSKEEIAEMGGRKYGNRRLNIIEGRFAKEEELYEGDYIAMDFDGAKTTIKEVGTKFNILKNQKMNNSGFETEEVIQENESNKV